MVVVDLANGLAVVARDDEWAEMILGLVVRLGREREERGEDAGDHATGPMSAFEDERATLLEGVVVFAR